MFHLISSIYTDLTQRPRFNVLCVGHSDSGKTTLLQVLKAQLTSTEGVKVKSVSGTPSSLPKTRPTVGQNVFDLQCPPPSPRPLIIPAYPPPQIDPALPASSSSSSSWWTSAPSSSTSTSANTKQPSKAVLHIWDLGGEKGLRSIWREYFDEADCVVYFWDCGDAGRGEAREEAWQTLASLARDPQLARLPFLVLLSRSDLTTRPDKGKARAIDDEESITASKTSTEADDEDGDLSLTIERPAGDSYESENKTQGKTSAPASPQPRQSTTAMMEDTDVLESLRMFIVSHVEALSINTEEAAAKEQRQKDEDADADAEADGTDDSDETTAFPETTIIPVSSLTGRGVVECVDWLVYKSLDSTRKA